MPPEITAEIGADIAREITARLRALDWSVSELSRQRGVSREVISGIVNGRRVPSVRSYERLRRSLGLLPAAAQLTRPAPPADFYEEHLSRLVAV
jgi:transcriptional regulator with XRE-family HTH domain